MPITARTLTAGLMALALCAGCSSDDAGDEAAPSAEATTTAAETSEPVDEASPTEESSASGEAEVSFDAEQQAVADVFELAVDPDAEGSSSAYAPDPELDGIIQAAGETREAQGSQEIGADVTEVTIDGDVANVAYTLLLNGAPTLQGTGTAVRVDGEWKVHVSSLCGLLSIAGPGPEGCSRVEPPA